MSLLDDARAESHTYGPVCSIAILYSTLSPEDAADLSAAFADPTITSAAIWRALAKRGARIGQSTISRHRSRACTCQPLPTS